MEMSTLSKIYTKKWKKLVKLKTSLLLYLNLNYSQFSQEKIKLLNIKKNLLYYNIWTRFNPNDYNIKLIDQKWSKS